MTALSLPLRSLRLAPALDVRTHDGAGFAKRLPHLEAYIAKGGLTPLSRHPGWLSVLEQGFGHRAYCLEAVEGSIIRGILPLAYVSSLLFGRFLVSLPYLDYGGVTADDDATAHSLIGQAVDLADELDVRYLELRHEGAIEHPSLGHRMNSKVHMRLPLPP